MSAKIFICSCEKSCAPDITVIAKGLEAKHSGSKGAASPELLAGDALCRAQSERLSQALAGAQDITITCKQEEPFFRDLLEERGFTGAAYFVDIRALAGWSSEGAAASPKMAALIAAAQMPLPALPFVSIESKGVALVYGRDEVAIRVGQALAETLDVTVMLAQPGDVAPPRRSDFPITKGQIRLAKGTLSAFELTIDDFAAMLPSSRGALRFGAARSNAISRCDLVIDVSGGTPLFSADALRDGYLRCDPRDLIGIERLIAKARDLVGVFDKPKYIDFKADLCAHSRSRITGCTRCLDICPTGAITPAGNAVAIDPLICAGCGGCAAVCPTGAAAYALPDTNALMARLRLMLRAYHAAGGMDAVLLFHDDHHGSELIDALARFGDGLPARVIPVVLNEITQIGLSEIAAGFAYGAAGIAFLSPERPKHDLAPLARNLALGHAILPALGHAAGALVHIAVDDPDLLLAQLRTMPKAVAGARAASFMPHGPKRQVTSLALREWRAHAPLQPERIDLPPGAPFGRVVLDEAGCTLCLACVSTCPVDALSANSERPELRFQEDLCVQCGLCAATCPEKVITLEPRLDFMAINASPVTLKQEEPYPCDCCGKLFGVKSTVETIKAKLSGQHWMFSGTNADRVKLIGYCDDCRVALASEQKLDPYAGSERPRLRTSDDYFRANPEDSSET